MQCSTRAPVGRPMAVSEHTLRQLLCHGHLPTVVSGFLPTAERSCAVGMAGEAGRTVQFRVKVALECSGGELSSSCVASDGQEGGSDGKLERERVQLLWEDFFSDPSLWWDNRLGKRSSRSPDFVHKKKGDVLWTRSRLNPPWTESRLALHELPADVVTKPGNDVPAPIWVQGKSCEAQRLCEQGRLEEAVDALLLMGQKGCLPSVQTYFELLQACRKQKALHEAKRVQAHIVENGPGKNTFLGEIAVNVFVKCGDLPAALLLFDKLSRRTALSWAALISGYANAGQGQKALMTYKEMQKQGVEPNKYTFGVVLQACTIPVDLTVGKQVHAELVRRSWESDSFLGKCLVGMYAKCGSMVDAQHVFETLSKRDVVSWNDMIRGYVKEGKGEIAIKLYFQMQEEGMYPDKWTFVNVLKACISISANEEEMLIDGQPLKMGSLRKGKAFHAELAGRNLESDAFVTNCLVNMYAKCGSLQDARQVFDGLSHGNVVLWNTMIAGYSQQEKGEMALQLYAQMQQSDVRPDQRTFVSVLKACAVLGALEEATSIDGQLWKVKSLQQSKVIHADVVKAGCDMDVFVENTIVDMYAKCRSMLDARSAFNALSHRNVVSWNAMMQGYLEEGESERAMELYSQMEEEGIRPDHWTFVCVLRACSDLAVEEKDTIITGVPVKEKSLRQARKIHAQLVGLSLDSDLYVGNTLMDLYAKCRSPVDARTVFDTLSQRNVVSWNVIIACYALEGDAHEALQLYADMQGCGFSPNDRTFVSVLMACGILATKEAETVVDGQQVKVKSLQKGIMLHAEVVRRGYMSDIYVGNSMVDMYAKCGSIVDARQVFDSLPQRTVVSWNAMIAGYAQQEEGENALQVYEHMRAVGEMPDDRTFVSLLKAVSSLACKEVETVTDGAAVKAESLQKGEALHAEALTMGFESDLYVKNTLVRMYANCGSLAKAQRVFDSLSQPDAVSWNALIAGYTQQGRANRALQLYADMLHGEVQPTEATFLSVLRACSNVGSLRWCKQIQSDILQCGTELSIRVSNTLIHVFGRCGSMIDAQDVFNTMPQQHTVASWNVLIAGYAKQGDSAMSLQCFEKMQLSGLKPDSVTFVSLLAACSHGGMTDKGLEFFNSMTEVFGITATSAHYVSIVDLLSRAGLFSKAEQLLLAMPVQPDLAVWLSLLSGCRKYVNIELGRRAFEHAVSLDPKQGGPYMLMANLYAHAHIWQKAKEIEGLRVRADAPRKHGESWIEVGDDVHQFAVGDTTHPQTHQVYQRLDELSAQVQNVHLAISSI